MMKVFILFMILCSSLQSFAQEQNVYFSLFDKKIYSLKNKGVGEFVVDVTSSKLTEQVNDQKVFGNVKELIFRVYWTQVPERLAIEVLGLPSGFFELKNQLKERISPVLENLVPPTIQGRFNGYKITAGKKVKEFLATDTTGLAAVPSYVLSFDAQDRLSTVVGNKPVGSLDVSWVYENKAFADGRWVISKSEMTNSEGGQTVKTTQKLNYTSSQGTGVLGEVVLTIEGSGVSSYSSTEEIQFKNYKINTGEAKRYFISELPVP